MEMPMNNGQGSGGGGRSTLCYSMVVDPGEASSGTGFHQDFLEMFGARHSSGDLFDLVRQGGAEGGSSMEVQPTSLRLPLSPPVTLPPSEDDMAVWLYPIVCGQEPAVVAGHDDDHQPSNEPAGLAVVDDAPADHKREKPPNMQEKCRGVGAEDSTENYSGGSRKKTTGGARRSHPAETHNLTEKRRRRKINEKFKTLQRLVPGCDDKVVGGRSSNQVSTLDQTIQHIKSLQQQIQVQRQAISLGCDGMKPPAVYPVVPPPPPPPPPPPYLPPGSGVAAASRPCSSGAGDGGERAHVRPGVVLAPPPAMVPFSPCLPSGA